MKKNDIFELEITDMGTDGEGIGHYDGMTFFVKDALIGDVITARATKLKKTMATQEWKRLRPLPLFALSRNVSCTRGVAAARYRRSPMKSSLNLKIIRCATISCV